LSRFERDTYQAWHIRVAKANIRLKKPTSHTRLLSRVAVLDVVWGGASPLAAYLLRDGTIIRPGAVAVYCGVAFLVSLLVFQWFQTSSPLSRFFSVRDAIEVLKACVLIAALSAAVAFLLTRLDDAPRAIPILHLMLLASALLGGRALMRLLETRRETRRPDTAKKVEHILIIGASRLAWFFSKMVEELAPAAYQIVAILDERSGLKHRSLNGYPIIGAPVDLEKVLADYAMHGVRIDMVVVAAQPADLTAAAWEEVCRVCRAQNIALEVLPERLISVQSAATEDAAASPQPMTPSTAPEAASLPSLDRPFWKIKRGLDFIVALILALLLSPIILIVCTLVLLDVGIPVVFWQRRVGRTGAPLYLYKFRTLQSPFNRRTKEKRETQQSSTIGRFLRTTRLDELPQLWNVLSGEMSLIGPRPLLPVDQPEGLSLRLTVRPGVTGWAQVCGGKLITVEEKNALDEWYIDHASFKLEISILARTVKAFLTGDRRDEKAISAALSEKPGGDDAGFSEAAELQEVDAPSGIVIQAHPAPSDAPAVIVQRAKAVGS
jgi:lipopolysaccharide/colanic/teichoic acid biosynthesis glycosyltransferase